MKHKKSDKRVFIIAEAGVNHNGDFNTALKMIDAAAKAGADAVKFQTFKAEEMVSADALKAEYQEITADKKETQLEMLKKLELDPDAHVKLMEYCGKAGIEFLSSPFDLESIDLLVSLGVRIIKVPSGEITNLPYLRKVGAQGKKVILSTGMSSLEEIRKALDVLTEAGTPRSKVTVLHCNTEYPTPLEDVNLSAMSSVREAFSVEVGYSDHTEGIEVAIAAAALGADVIEKHFTLDKNMKGPDHRASLDPEELTSMVSAIRGVEKAMGDGVKRPSMSEAKNKDIVRKSIVASRKINKGEAFTEKNITVKRPFKGMDPMRWDHVIGGLAKRDFEKDEAVEL